MRKLLKSFSGLAGSAVFAGLVAAFTFHTDLLLTRTPAGEAPLLSTQSLAAVELPVTAQAEISSDAAQPSASRGLHAARPVTLLLREPVVVLSGQGPKDLSLPRGTSVRLLASNGPFLLVRYAQGIVTVPRSSVVSGVARTY